MKQDKLKDRQSQAQFIVTRPDYTLVPRVQWVHLSVPSSVGTEITNIHRWGAGLRPWGNIIGIGCIVRLCRVKSASFFSVAERRSLPLLSKMMKMKSAGPQVVMCLEMAVSYPLAGGESAPGRPLASYGPSIKHFLKAGRLPKPIIISVPRPHCWKGSASKPYMELPPHTAPLGMEVGPAQACAFKESVPDNKPLWSYCVPMSHAGPFVLAFFPFRKHSNPNPTLVGRKAYCFLVVARVNVIEGCLLLACVIIYKQNPLPFASGLVQNWSWESLFVSAIMTAKNIVGPVKWSLSEEVSFDGWSVSHLKKANFITYKSALRAIGLAWQVNPFS
ncbi:hypothetical protein VNO78_02838 [Psophocarpus tetragonolobus]|uniref:Uncharacterized protein n=1 Tax=Psophocarpus tetragonolobus TaxID=3891 RepID=A0AAN9XV23_PSOTE